MVVPSKIADFLNVPRKRNRRSLSLLSMEIKLRSELAHRKI